MKANELMIGNYVSVIESNPSEMAIGLAKVVGIDRKISIEPYTIGLECSYYDDNGEERIHLFSVSTDRLRPISLTAKILEKNGFVYNDMPFAQTWEGYGLSIYGMQGNYRINCGVNVSMNVSSVHQLQHVLRLCGIEKEIKL